MFINHTFYLYMDGMDLVIISASGLAHLDRIPLLDAAQSELLKVLNILTMTLTASVV
jgi:hypothetical protein